MPLARDRTDTERSQHWPAAQIVVSILPDDVCDIDQVIAGTVALTGIDVAGAPLGCQIAGRQVLIHSIAGATINTEDYQTIITGGCGAP